MSFDHDIHQCIKILNEGGVILYPTDTVWGLGCDATNEEAVTKIYNIKKRRDSKAMIVLAANERDVLKHTSGTDLSIFDYLQKAEKPTTVIYDHAIGFAKNLTAEDGSIAIRICRDEFCKAIINRLGKPIVSTSANFSGAITPPNFKSIDKEIIDAADYVVQYRQDDETQAQSSSIIKWNNGEIAFIRK